MNLKTVIKKPLVTEKTMKAAENNRYTFEVDMRANKNQIKQALKEYFDVEAIKVRTSIVPSSTKRTGRRWLKTTTGPTKKAVIELRPGQSIKAFEG